MTSKEKDIKLAGRIAAGDKAAMKQLYDNYAMPLSNFVKSWLADPQEAADIVHETMLEVWRRADRYKGEASLKSWMFSIARYKSIDKNRKNSRLSYTDIEPEITDDSLNPSDIIVASQDADYIRAAIATLSPSHQRAIHLAFYADMSYKEIADIEDCPVGTVKTRILYAKKHLMRKLKSMS